MPGYMRHTHDGQREVRLGRVQREQLQLCADAPQRRSPGNPTMRALAGHGFVESVRHVSTRTHRPTLATIRIPRLVGKTNKSGLTSWYWQPSATLAKKGWHPRPLGTGGSLEDIPETSPRRRASSTSRSTARPSSPAELRRIQRPLTLDQAIKRWREPASRRSRSQGPRSSRDRAPVPLKCRTLEAWGKGVALSSITPSASPSCAMH
jgi:hypothetical protein